MLGAIIGDIVGSPWEFRRIKTKNFPLFGERNGITDDSILTVAVADALLNGRDPAESLRDWARRVKPGPHVAGYGKKFIDWVAAPTVQPPYGSFGNGGAMRVSPAAFLATSLEDCLDKARRVTEITHNHPEGMKGALATAHAIWLARQGEPAAAIRLAIAETYGYDMSRNVDEIREVHIYNETAAGCVPEALTCALEAKDFEDAIRNAVSLGGDADTLASIAGGLAEAMFGIPEEIWERGVGHLPEEMRDLLTGVYRAIGQEDKLMKEKRVKRMFDAMQLLRMSEANNKINLALLVADTSFWVSPDIHRQLLEENGNNTAAIDCVRRARNGEKRRTVVEGNIKLDDNSFANRVLKSALGFSSKQLIGFAVCHIWPDTCYDVRYHTAIANLVLMPNALAGLSDHHPGIQAALQYHAYKIYDWHPEGEKEPENPDNYPENWQVPEPKPPEWKRPSFLSGTDG